ncbi:MAG: VOC family protein [Deltaproteobacteria bacterium]|nr:VOC family protein [Deltaproteobacteria bacterium]
MGEMTKFDAGMFCWAELATRDAGAAKSFYGEVFGWKGVDSPTPMGPYTMLQLGGKDAAGLFSMSPEMQKQGIPPHWGCYIAVASADETAKKVTAAGGKVVQAPFDVMDSGRMLVAQDPTGAMISFWEAKKHIGARVVGEPGAVCWNELLTRDTAAATKFYAAVCGWTAQTQQMPVGPYTVFSVGGKEVAGMMAINPSMGPMPPNWAVYFQVASCDATVERAKRQGGQVVVPAQDVPTVGRFAVVMDPQQAVFALLQPSM